VFSFTKSLAQEYADSGVGIFNFSPGLVITDMLTALMSSKATNTG